MTVGRNDPCPCGSGTKFKKCCAAKWETTTAGLTAAVRMKGGVSFDPADNAYRGIVHSWDNAECIGEPQEWQSAETFESEDAAMAFYKSSIRPGLERLMAEASRKVKDGTFMQQAVRWITRFYRNYVSMRFVKDQLVLRLRNHPSASAIEALNDDFADIIAGENIHAITATPEGLEDTDHIELPRLAFGFDRRQ